MTKRDSFSFGAGGNDVADLDLSVVDDDPVDEQFDQLAALLEGEVSQCRLEALTEVRHALRERSDILLLLGLRLQLAELLSQAVERLQDLLPLARELRAVDDLGEVGGEQAFLLAL
jgi:hypothetical protein